MSNTFQPTSFSAGSSAFTQLGSLLNDAGFAGISNASITGQNGYIKNTSSSVNLYIGFGTSAPTSYATIPPLNAVLFLAGMNVNEVWVKAASSTVTVDFVEGAVNYQPPTIDGIVGSITLTENQVPKADASGDLVASSVTDDGTTFTIDEDVEVAGNATLGGTLAVTGIITTTAATNLGAEIAPSTNDGAALGDATHNFSDLFLATGAVINYANGNVAITHSSAILTMGTGEFRITTPGTNAASVPTLGSTSTFTNKTLTSPAINTPTINSGAALGATSTEIDQFNDVSAYQESIIAAGAITVTKKYSGLALVGAGAVTLAVPGASMLGQTKTIEMTADNGDVTLALTNVVGQSSGTTATFNDVRDSLVLLALSDKWLVIKEFGITLS